MIEYFSVVRVRGVLAGLFNTTEKSLRVVFDRDGDRLWLKGRLTEGETGLNLPWAEFGCPSAGLSRPMRFALRTPWWLIKTHQAPFHALILIPMVCIPCLLTPSLSSYAGSRHLRYDALHDLIERG